MKSAAMRKSIFIVVLSLFLLIPASITRAQTITSQKGLTVAIFPTQYGNVKVYLPDDIRPGDIISGTIIAEPVGKNIKQLEQNLSDLVQYSVMIDGNKFPVTSNSLGFKWLVDQDRQLSCPIDLLNVSGFTAFELTYQFKQSVTDHAFQNSGCGIPSHVIIGAPMRITGPFDGDASNTKCTMGDKSLEILAESPRQICSPVSIDLADPGGNRAVYVAENGKAVCSNTVSLVNMNVSAGKLSLRKGERTHIDVSITGLQNLLDTALLTLSNITPGVVVMQPANNIAIPLSPDSVSAGVFNRRFTIQSKKSGNFAVNVNLDLPENSGIKDSPPIQFEQKELKEPRRLENEALQTGLHQALKKIIADAGGAAGKEWDNVCDNCKQCIEARLGTWAENLVEKLGMDILKEFAGKAVSLIGDAVKSIGAAKDFFDKVSDKADKAEELAKSIEEKIKAGDLQVMEFKPDFCKKTEYCLISGTIFYNPKTGCLLAIMKCEGTKLCCPVAQTKVVISYCTDEKGMPVGKPQISVIK